MEVVLHEKEKVESKAVSGLKALKDNIKQEEKKKKQVEKSLADDKKTLANKERDSSGMQETFDKLRQEDDKCQAELEAAQAKYQAASLGETIVEGGGSATLQEQVMNFKQKISKAETEVKAADTKIKHNNDQLQKKQIEMKKSEALTKRDQGNLSKFEKDVQDLKARLGRIQYEEGTLERLEAEVRPLNHKVNGLRQQVEGGEARFHGLKFDYRDPERNFDRKRILGVAAKLFNLRDSDDNIDFSTALETVAGGKLYNVVIDTDTTGTLLLKSGNLQHRKTFIPLNKVVGSNTAKDKIGAAVRVAGQGNVWAALDLIDYDRRVEPAIMHLFGNTLICRDLNVANKVAFHNSVHMSCVTLEGDKVSPGGDMSGGAQKSGGSVLAELYRLRGKQVELEQAQEQLDITQRRIREVQPVAENWNNLNQQLEVKQAELEAIRARLQQTAHFQLAETVKQLEADNVAVKAGVEQAKLDKEEWAKAVKDLQYRIDNAEKIRDQEMEAVALAIQGWAEQIATAEDQLSVIQEEVRVAKAVVKEQKDALAANSKLLNAKSDRKEQLKKAKDEHGLETQKLEHKEGQCEAGVKEAKARLQDMVEQHEWIKEDRKFFGQPNTHYDFKATDPQEAGQRIQKLEATKDKLSKNVNMRAMNMLGKAEEQCTDLVKKKKIVEEDKKKITLVIKELDEKKKQALRTAWDQVNKDFGSIFSKLLPGTTAKLEPPQGQDVLDGLEVKVAFGGKWKDSLSELSGGQRSLVALSLILALLLFKPAPIYILDEVDSALDLSHTQNIGQMIRRHFPHSQFVVVSLKEGMFNNANVLFRTRFIDGTSTVTRTTLDESEEQPSKKRRS